MTSATAAYPSATDTLNQLTALGMRGARVLVRLMEVEQAAADLVASAMPASMAAPASLNEATEAGLSLDQMTVVMANTVPRAEKLALALERVSRAVRRSVALSERIGAGWPRAGRADDRPAMVRRQVKRGVSEVIRRVSDSDTAERLFDDLEMQLMDPALAPELLDLPVEAIVRRICRDIGLAVEFTAVPEAVRDAGVRPRARRGPPSG